MKKVRVFQVSIKNLVLRFYLMIALVTLFGMIGQWEIAAIVGFVTGVSAILGVGYEPEHRAEAQRPMLRKVRGEREMRKAS